MVRSWAARRSAAPRAAHEDVTHAPSYRMHGAHGATSWQATGPVAPDQWAGGDSMGLTLPQSLEMNLLAMSVVMCVVVVLPTIAAELVAV